MRESAVLAISPVKIGQTMPIYIYKDGGGGEVWGQYALQTLVSEINTGH